MKVLRSQRAIFCFIFNYFRRILHVRIFYHLYRHENFIILANILRSGFRGTLRKRGREKGRFLKMPFDVITVHAGIILPL